MYQLDATYIKLTFKFDIPPCYIVGSLWRWKVTTVTFTQIQNYRQITCNRGRRTSVGIVTAQWI